MVNALLNSKQLTSLEAEGLHCIFTKARAEFRKQRTVYLQFVDYFFSTRFHICVCFCACCYCMERKVWRGDQKSASCEVKLYARSTEYFEICKENPSTCSIVFLQLSGVILDRYY